MPIGLLFGFLIASPQLLPVLKHSQTSHRKNVPSEAGYEAYIGSAIKPFEFANLVTTKALGDPRTPVEVNENLTVAEYWPPLAKQGANFAESAVTIGPLVLGLLFLVPWRDPRTWPMAAIGVLALLLAMGTVLNKALYFWLPGWSSTGSPGRVIVLFVMAACVLAGLGVRSDQLNKRHLGIAALGLVGFTLLSLFVFPGAKPAWQNGMEQLGTAVESIASVGILPSALLALVFGIAALAIWYKPQTTIYKPLILGLTVLIAILGYALTLIPTGMPLAKIQGPANPHDRIAIVNENWGIIAPARDALMPPNLAALSRIHELGGYDSLLNAHTKSILDKLNDQDSAPPANGNIMFVKPTADPQDLSAAGVSERWASDSQGIYTEATIAGPGRASINGKPTNITQESFSAVNVEAGGPGILTIRDRNMPGWTVTIKGKLLALKQGTWLELDIPPGNHEVQFHFVSPGYSTGLFLAVPAWLLVLVGLAGGRIKKGKVETS